jgi:hypothetical protein
MSTKLRRSIAVFLVVVPLEGLEGRALVVLARLVDLCQLPAQEALAGMDGLPMPSLGVRPDPPLPKRMSVMVQAPRCNCVVAGVLDRLRLVSSH